MKTIESTVEDLRGLIGNPDAYAVQHDDGTWSPVRSKLSSVVLRKHLRGDVTVGTYIVKPPDRARTLVFDIDDPEKSKQLEMLRTLTTVLTQQTSIGTRHATEWSGGKGYHVWVVADDYMPAETLYRIGRGVRTLAGLPSLEVFPKQTKARDLGNLVKLPGGVHRVSGKRYDFLDRVPPRVPVSELEEIADRFVEVRASRGAGEAIPSEFPCVERIQAGVKEGGRNLSMFHLATMLRRKGALTDENVRLVLDNVNTKNAPPLDVEELDNLVESSKSSGPICRQLPGDVACEDCPFEGGKNTPGLYMRPGALRHSRVSERIVLEVVERTPDGVVELTHPDVEQVRAHLRDDRRAYDRLRKARREHGNRGHGSSQV